jgi:hypothetical protein
VMKRFTGELFLPWWVVPPRATAQGGIAGTHARPFIATWERALRFTTRAPCLRRGRDLPQCLLAPRPKAHLHAPGRAPKPVAPRRPAPPGHSTPRAKSVTEVQFGKPFTRPIQAAGSATAPGKYIERKHPGRRQGAPRPAGRHQETGPAGVSERRPCAADRSRASDRGTARAACSARAVITRPARRRRCT